MSEEIKGMYLASDDKGIKYELSIENADSSPGLIQGHLTIDMAKYDVQGSYRFDDGKWTPANIIFNIAPFRETLKDQPDYLSPPINNLYFTLPNSCGEFSLTSSETLTGNLFAESFKQLTGQGKIKDKKTGTTKTIENMIFKKN